MCMFVIIRHLETYADTTWRYSATYELRMLHNFVAMNGHLPIYCFLGISLVPNYILSIFLEYVLPLVLTRDSKKKFQGTSLAVRIHKCNVF